MKFVWASLLISFVFPVLAEVDAQAIAMNCMNCHQPDTTSDEDTIPQLKDFSRQQLLQALLDFKYEKKSATLMPRIVKGYSDHELAAVASHLGCLE